MIERQLIFKTLDNPIRILFWGIDEFLLMAIPIMLGLCSGSTALMFFLIFKAAILKNLYSKVKRLLPYGSLRQLLYWYQHPFFLRKMGRIRHLPSSHYRELLL